MTARARRGAVRVRQGARGRALRIGGTLASWYRPGQARTDSVWDALAAPLLLLPPKRRRRVLILGLGGGSVARVVRALAPGAHIVGVEIDPEVVRAAHRWFDLDELSVDVVRADAHGYLQRPGGRYDAVIEDIFVGSVRTLRKPDWLPSPGLRRAARRLRPGGVLASNSIEETAAVVRIVRPLFDSTLRIDVEGYDNRIVVGAPGRTSARALRGAVAGDPLLAPTLRRLSFRTLSLPPPRERRGLRGGRSGTRRPSG